MRAALLATLVAAAAAFPQEAGHGGRHGNPEDIEAYIAHLEDPSRAEWQKPDEVVRALRLRPGQTVCDVGAGSGYFALRLSRVVKPSGRVYAVDVEARMLEALRERLQRVGLRNVTPILALPEDPLLPLGGCDLILIVNTYHHFPEGPSYLRRLSRFLVKKGRIVNIDFHKRETPVGPPLSRRIAREDFLKDATAAGLTLHDEHTFLPYQYFVVLGQR